MNLLAVILAALGIFFFVSNWAKSTDIGLALCTAAFVAAFVVQSGPSWVIH